MQFNVEYRICVYSHANDTPFALASSCFFSDTIVLVMKAIALFAIVLVAAQLALAGKPTFTVCGGSWTDVKVEPKESTWTSGMTAHFTITATLPAEVQPGAHVYTDIKIFGEDYESKDDDMCSYAGTPFQCPIAAGTHTWDFDFEIPSVPFAVDLTTHSIWRKPDGSDEYLCLDMAVSV